MIVVWLGPDMKAIFMFVTTFIFGAKFGFRWLTCRVQWYTINVNLALRQVLHTGHVILSIHVWLYEFGHQVDNSANADQL